VISTDGSAPIVLLVEDDVVEMMSIERVIRSKGLAIDLRVATDGLEALELLRGPLAIYPRLILLDLNMPRMSGFELLAELRSDPALAGLKVIVLTTSDAAQDRERAEYYNVAEYIVKNDFSGDFESFARVLEARMCSFAPEARSGVRGDVFARQGNGDG
jgi:CheY-like chemotaxis protein